MHSHDSAVIFSLAIRQRAVSLSIGERQGYRTLSIKKNGVAELVTSFELAGIAESLDDFRYEHDPRS